jgi:hypothetical protein
MSVEFQNCSSWVKAEKLCSIVDALEDEAGLQRKKARLGENYDLCLLLPGVNNMGQMFSKCYGTSNQ